MSYSSNALSIGGVIVLRRPTPFGGALVVPKHRRLDRIVWTERVLQRTVLAIVASANLLIIISRICSCWDSARFGAIVGYLGLKESSFATTSQQRSVAALCILHVAGRAQLKIATKLGSQWSCTVKPPSWHQWKCVSLDRK